MLTTEADVYDRVRTQIGKLARRAGRSLMTPSESDEDALRLYLEDALSEIATITERLNASLQLPTVAGQGYLERPPHLYAVDEAAVFEGDSAYPIDVEGGADVAQLARTPKPEKGRPCELGPYQGRLYFWPVPDAEYTIDLQIRWNGTVGDTAPAGPQDPPQVDTVVDRVPGELERALAGYVTGEWLEEIGEAKVAKRAMSRFERDVRRFRDEPVHDSTSTVTYRPLGF